MNEFKIPSFAVILMLNEQSQFPDFEVCGLLLGLRDSIEYVVPMRNTADMPDREFSFDPNDQIRIMKLAADQSRNIVGVYHSHVERDAYPSPPDVRFAQAGHHQVIMNKSSIRSYVIVDGEAIEEKIVLDY